jgi:hypothetical protein
MQVLSGDPIHGSRSIFLKQEVRLDSMTKGDAGGRSRAAETLGLGSF